MPLTKSVRLFPFRVKDPATGLGVTGLTPTFLTFVHLDPAAPAAVAPAIFESAGGWYAFNYMVEDEDLSPFVATVDCGIAVTDVAERYKEILGLYNLSDAEHNGIAFADLPAGFHGSETDRTTVDVLLAETEPDLDGNPITLREAMVGIFAGTTNGATGLETPIQNFLSANGQKVRISATITLDGTRSVAKDLK